jgi:tRNA A-37 threonylcarbamoyl transferase component Bud32/predicted nucleotidyltransferase
MSIQLKESMKENLVEIFRKIADSRQITAACLYGSQVCGYANKKTDINVLLILNGFTPRLNTFFEAVNGGNASILTVNRTDFERDVRRGWLGEFVSEKITFPYEPLTNGEYLRSREVEVKKRIVSELLGNLILEFPESSHEFLIKKEYFMYEVMMRRAKLFPPLTYSFLNMSRRNLRRRNMEAMMEGYLKALNELAKEKVIFFSNGYIKIARNHIGTVKRRKSRLPFFLRSVQRLAMQHILSVYSKTVTSLIQDQRIFMENHRKVNDNGLVSRLEDPKKYILLPTHLGEVSLSDRSDIIDVVRKIIKNGESKVRIESIGGVLNDVYILTLTKNGEKQKFVVKRFRDWSNLKWLSLALWSFGTTPFAVLGRSRLEREYAINKFLHSKGVPVPKILYISPQKRLLFEEFIEGKKLVEPIKRITSSNKNATDVILMREVGRSIAEAHRLGVSLGDCKPENFVTDNGKVFFLDLEQATRDGDKTWDVAEFLYYSGHYSSPMSSSNAASTIARNFIDGYLEAGGNEETVKKAAAARYTKVFSVFTPPHILLAISNICQKMGNNQGNDKSEKPLKGM